MIHYNPELHHNTIVSYIAHSILTGMELATKFPPEYKDGSYSNDVILITEDEAYSIPPLGFLQLRMDAFTYAYNRAKSITSQYEQLENNLKQNFWIGLDTLEKYLDEIHQTAARDLWDKITNSRNPIEL